MKLLVFHPALAPYRVDFFNLLGRLFKAHVVFLGRNLEEQKFDQKRLLARLKCRVSFLTNGFMFCGRYVRTGFISLIRRERPDVVLGFEFSPLTVIIILYRLVFRARFGFYTMTDDNAEMFQATRGVRKLLRCLVLRFADGVIVTNQAVADLLKSRGVRVAVVPIIYEREAFRANQDSVYKQASVLRRKLDVENGRILLTVGRLAKVKNQAWLIETMARSFPDNVKLVIVGGGPEELALKQTIDAHPDLKGRIVFAGRHEGDDLMAYFAAADIFVLPSVFEPYGAVVSEALLWGVPCLVSSHVGAKDLIENGCGCVFEVEKAGDFHAKLSLWLSQLPSWQMGRPSLLRMNFCDLRDELRALLGGDA